MLRFFTISQLLLSAVILSNTIIALPNQISARTTLDTATTSPAPLPVPRNCVYIQTFHDPATGSPLELRDLVNNPTGITHIILAAFHITSTSGDIRLNDYPPNDHMYDQLWSDMEFIQGKGVKVMALLGGAGKGSYTILENNATFDSYYLPFLNILRNYTLDGLDLDIEESIPITLALSLLQRLNNDLGTKFLLTMAPVGTALLPPLIPGEEIGLSGFNYPQLDLMAKDDSRPAGKLVSWYNAQFYNGWGDSSNQIFYDILTLSQQFSPSRIVMGVLDSPADGGSGWYSLSTYQSVITQLRANSANFGGVIAWEYYNAGQNDSLTQPWQWVQGINSALTAPKSSLPALNTAVSPLVRPEVPWPSQTTKLQKQGATWEQGVWALNCTDGNMAQAQKLLGL